MIPQYLLNIRSTIDTWLKDSRHHSISRNLGLMNDHWNVHTRLMYKDTWFYMRIDECNTAIECAHRTIDRCHYRIATALRGALAWITIRSSLLLEYLEYTSI